MMARKRRNSNPLTAVLPGNGEQPGAASIQRPGQFQYSVTHCKPTIAVETDHYLGHPASDEGSGAKILPGTHVLPKLPALLQPAFVCIRPKVFGGPVVNRFARVIAIEYL